MPAIKRRPFILISHYSITKCPGVWSALRIDLGTNL
jgi:hypothetical protein